MIEYTTERCGVWQHSLLDLFSFYYVPRSRSTQQQQQQNGRLTTLEQHRRTIRKVMQRIMVRYIAATAIATMDIAP